MKDLLLEVIKNKSGFLELRYHKRVANSFLAQKGRVDVASHAVSEGIGVRAFIQGAWGFAATSDVSKNGIEKAIREAETNASILAKAKGRAARSLHGFDRSKLSQVDYLGDGFHELLDMPLQDKLAQVTRFERELARSSTRVQSARCRYSEILEEKSIVTTDGAQCSLKIAQPEISLSMITEKDGERATSHRGAGVEGGWRCLFNHPSLVNVVEETAKIGHDLLNAKHPEGGLKTVILAPSVVGLLCHEAIGHTVEADFVKSGSVAQGKIGHVVASPLVTMADSGLAPFQSFAAGSIPFDDEGVTTENTVIIDKGILSSYLHNRETAGEFGVAPTGNARAWLFNDEPIIRMRNTYLMPGESNLSTMISEIDDGYLVEGAGSGQADANGEFMFGTGYVYRIRGGKKAEILKEATLSGIAFNVLKSVDRVSKEFLWDLGTGYCGKGQAAKVDAGGPFIRCQIAVGGREE